MNESEIKKSISRKLEIPRPKGVSENWLLIVSGRQLSQSMGLRDVEEPNAFQEVNAALENGPYDEVEISICKTLKAEIGRRSLWRKEDAVR